jgi:hypothetical protein
MSQSINSNTINDNVKLRKNAYIFHSTDLAALKTLADEIRTELDHLQDHDAIHACGKVALAIIKTRPVEALQLAKDHIQYQPYREVRRCWLRLYEDASLWRAAELLCDTSEMRSEIEPDKMTGTDDWMSQIVRVLDLGLVVSGGTHRGELYEAIFANLESFVGQDDFPEELSAVFKTDRPGALQSKHLVPSVSQPSLEAFQIHLNNHMTPILLTNTINDWPAMTKWQTPTHLLHLTLGGRRCIPIEIGETYTHTNWRQEILSLRTFMQTYLLTNAKEIGYLGQHNLFRQIPSLQRDIRTPDYCYTVPPNTSLPTTDDPEKNIWLGPKGTRTPLHTDPYHNIFAQVVGYKYVRLYPPQATGSLCPRGVDENGIDESNTAGVEIRFAPSRGGNLDVEDEEKFPIFVAEGRYWECVVGPGECLYIPAGWWHYVEALTGSWSVSFWWG